jgi:hypothetical protein
MSELEHAANQVETTIPHFSDFGIDIISALPIKGTRVKRMPQKLRIFLV